MINADSSKRGEISELLITNYESDNLCYGEMQCITGNTNLKLIVSN